MTDVHVPQQSKTYWRSAEHLADLPEVREAMQREFPAGAAEHSGLDDAVSRRRFLGVVAASAALAGLTSCRKPAREILPYTRRPDGLIPGIPNHYASVHDRGGYGIGVLVRSNEGRPTKIEGNPDHPSSLGGTDSWMQAELLQLYDPARSQHILHDGSDHKHHEGGDHDHEHDEEHPEHYAMADFDAAWSSRLQTLAGKQGKGLALVAAPTSSPTFNRLLSEMKAALPQATVHSWSPIADDMAIAGSRAAFGMALNPQYDLSQAAVVASFDADFLGVDAQSLATMRQWGDSRRVDADNLEATLDGKREPSRLYVAEACYSVTGSNADHRLRASDGEVVDALFAVAAELGVSGLDGALAPWKGRSFEITTHVHKDDGTTETVQRDFVKALAADLQKHGGKSVVMVGPRQPAAAHAIAHAINNHLGSVGGPNATDKPVAYKQAPEGMGAGDSLASMAALAASMQSGATDTVVCLGTNPVHTAPADLGFAELFDKAEFTVHVGMQVDETAQKATWHLPAAHELESWGDLLAFDGTASIAQPLIAPLYHDCHSAVEVLARMIQADETEGYALVRATWESRMSGDFEAGWSKALHDGVVAGTTAPTGGVPAINAANVATAVGTHKPSEALGPQAIELGIRVDPSVMDGRYVNNPWMQELPSPIEKLCWDNAVLMSRATAEANQLVNDDVVELTVDGRSVRGAVWIQPGHADHVVTVTIGQGRADLPAQYECAFETGYNAYPLRSTSAPWSTRGVTMKKTGATYPLVSAQDHGVMEGRPLVREATLDHFREHPDFAPEMSPLAKAASVKNSHHGGHGDDGHGGEGHDDHSHSHTHADGTVHVVEGHEDYSERKLLKSLWKERDYSKGYQWGMVIDLNSCTGCSTCVVACVSENNIPMVGKAQVANGREMFWNRMDRYFSGEADDATGIALDADPQIVHQMVPCMQCENAPCESVCPVAATVHNPEGLNDMAYNRCIGTRYCSNNCPYKVRRFNWFSFNADNAPTRKLQFNPDVTVRHRGVMEKCTYCVQRINAGKFAAKKAGQKVQDGAIVTACQQACPTNAIAFGNINDPEAQVTKLKGLVKTDADGHEDVVVKPLPTNYAMLSELNVKPRTTYLAQIRNPNPELS